MQLDRRGLALALLLGVSGVACQAEGRTFQTTLPLQDREPFPVALIDETELVTGIAPAQVDLAWGDVKPVLHAVPDDAGAAVLSWLGGLCDRDATMRFHVVHGDYLLNVAIHDPGSSCPAAGVPRAIRIAMSRSIPIASIVVAGGNP
jgi:hypothetical protein